MPDWSPDMPRILAALDRMRERRKPLFPRRMSSCTWGPDGKVLLLMSRRHYALLLVKRIPGLVNQLLCHSRRWRRLMCEWWRPVDCTCTFADFERHGHSAHPTEGCPFRTDCGGQTFSPPCGGCDRCLDDQQAYYEAQDKGLI